MNKLQVGDHVVWEPKLCHFDIEPEPFETHKVFGIRVQSSDDGEMIFVDEIEWKSLDKKGDESITILFDNGDWAFGYQIKKLLH